MSESADEVQSNTDAVAPAPELSPLSAITQETRTRMRVKVSELKDNPFSLSIYPPEPDMQMIESIRRTGLLELPVVDRNMVLQRGHRRVRSCRYLQIEEIDVEVTSITDPETLKLMVIEHNRARVKGWRIRLREAEELKLRLQPLAKERQRTGGKTGSVLNCAQGRLGRKVRSQLAEYLGISHETLRRVHLIAEENPSLLDDIDAGDESINSAYRQVVKTMPRPFPPRTSSKPNLLVAEHNRAAYTLGREIAERLTFPYPVDGPAYSCLLQGLRDALVNKASPVDLSDCQPRLIALAPSLFEGPGADQPGAVPVAAPAAIPVAVAASVPFSPYFETDGPDETSEANESASASGVLLPQLMPVPL